MKTRVNARATIIALALASQALLSAESGIESGLSVYGTLTAEATAGLDKRDQGKSGFEHELRLVLEGAEDGLTFRAEGGYTKTYGLASKEASVFASGLLPSPNPAVLPPETDLHRELFVDQAWASGWAGDLEIKAGIVPIAWGSAYLYNPTARTAQADFPGDDMDRAKGKPGVALTLALPRGFAAEAYALASPRVDDPIPSIGEGSIRTIPVGARLSWRGTNLDASLSFIQERTLPAHATPSSPDAAIARYAGVDLTVPLGDATLYAEAALPIERALHKGEAAAGVAWALPGPLVTLRCEYIRLGGGSNPEGYDITRILSGETALLGRDYLFVGAEKEDTDSARWNIETGCLMNLSDRSFALACKAAWRPRPAFELTALLRAFTAVASERAGNAEFGRSFTPTPGVEWRPYRSAIGLSASWSF